MRCLLAQQWSDGALDYYCGPEEYRVEVQAFANLESLTGIYFVREHTLRILWNYVQEVGLVGVWRKVTSRLQEKYRNEKFVSFGIGAVVQGPAGGTFSIGERVAFLAPGFPACIERIVLPELFLARGPNAAGPAARSGSYASA